ncbi:MAG TPA: polyketide cyclase [Pseudonocardia sp.]|nr:polyketide cyclase [Pseudonocardia sp.]
MTDRIEVQRTIRAEPSTIFNVLTDPDGHVTIDASGMLMSSTGRPVTAVGDTFVVHMDREALGDRPLGLYDVTVKILKFEQDKEIAWTVESGLLDTPLEHVYGYRLEPGADGGTLVTSYYDWSNIPQVWKDRGLEFPIVPESALKATLGILARTVQTS